MNSEQIEHLNSNQLLQAVVDRSDLPEALQAHLGACLRCRTEKERFEQELTHLGDMAARLAPMPSQPITLPRPAPRSALGDFLSGRRVFGAALTVAAAVLLVVLGTFVLRTAPVGQTGHSHQELLEARQLMTEVDLLVENALPQVYLEIAGDAYAASDDEFIRFLIPPLESDSLTSMTGKRGLVLC
ncbi:MAG: hypothetical protein JSW39_23975 [Desulfobacterales bacterium]|nr:MAG: hypothetical protein JSW39_23975 [Desulfobacterales bacterium]